MILLRIHAREVDGQGIALKKLEQDNNIVDDDEEHRKTSHDALVGITSQLLAQGEHGDDVTAAERRCMYQYPSSGLVGMIIMRTEAVNEQTCSSCGS